MPTISLSTSFDSSSEEPWPAERPERRPLATGEVHVWCATLDLPAEAQRRLELALSAEEGERIARVRPPLTRRRLAASRGMLREILAAYLPTEPRDLRLTAAPGGKPVLAGVGEGRDDVAMADEIRFNLAHSGWLALVAVGRGRRIGVDVEAVRPVPAAEALARRFFTERERASLAGAPVGERNRAFLSCWTRKEACVKALGEGFWAAARRFEVSVSGDAPARVVAVDGDPRQAHDWSLLHLAPARGYVGALAVRGGVSGVRLLRLAGSDVRGDAPEGAGAGRSEPGSGA